MSTDQTVIPEAVPEILPPVDTGVEAITELKTSTTDDPNLPALSTRTLSGGVKETLINTKKFIESVFYGLEIPNGTYKGEKISPQLIQEVEETGDELLALSLEEMFEGENAAKCKSFQTDVTARVQSPVNTKAKELKQPVNQFRSIMLDLPKQALGRIPEIHEAMIAKNKQFTAEKEKRDREAAQKDAAWQKETTSRLVEVSGLPGKLSAATAAEVEEALQGLGENDYRPHENFIQPYADAVAAAKTTLATMLESKVKEETEAQQRAEDEVKKQAERDSELKRLQEEEVQQQLKDEATDAYMRIMSLYTDNVTGTAQELEDAATLTCEICFEFEGNEYFNNQGAKEIVNKITSAHEVACRKEKEDNKKKEEREAQAKKEAEAQAKREREALVAENTQLILDAGYTLYDDGFGHTDYRKAGRTLVSVDAIERGVSREFVLDAIEKTEKHIIRDKEIAEERVVKEIRGLVEEARNMNSAAEVEERFFTEGTLAIYGGEDFSDSKRISDVLGETIETIKAIAKFKRAEEEKAKKEHAARFAAAKEEMSAAVLALGTHEEIIAAIIDGSIPHVQFEV